MVIGQVLTGNLFKPILLIIFTHIFFTYITVHGQLLETSCGSAALEHGAEPVMDTDFGP